MGQYINCINKFQHSLKSLNTYANDNLSKRFFKDTVGNNSDTTITVTHNFGTRFVLVQCADNKDNGTDPGETVLVDTERDTDNTVKLHFASAPATNSIDVMIVNCNI